MIEEIPMTILLSVDARLARRAQRLQFAVTLIERGISEKEARQRVARKFPVSPATAWRTVSAAQELVQ